MMYVKKESFHLKKFTFENGIKIPVQIGYETYGKLNREKSNAILVCHYFSATSHAAGKYTEQDLIPGWWDGLIGPGKAIDTDRYFVICTDNLCNVQVKNPYVITTGPKSVNPITGSEYGMGFPVFTFLDVARVQYELVNAMGITRLHAVIGPSAGGMIAQQWAVRYPHMVERMIGVITNPQNLVVTSVNVLQNAIEAIQLDPKWNDGNYGDEQPTKGLHLAGKMMFINGFDAHYYETTFPRNSTETLPYENFSARTSFEQNINALTLQNITFVDANSWMYTAKATLLHDLAHGFSSLEGALSQIEADVLMIPCKQDLLQPSRYNYEMVELLQKQGKYAEVYEIESINGHMAGVFDVHLFEKKVDEFLKRRVFV
ncbi:alpha/beta fold hydrolase [Bacillus pseudomycoides]|uniref:Probable acyltransferase n=1 Tax=Bacillus pseudomycoides TaxID=64104 RepID=A0ABD6TDH2_9BACI|nr:homoserine O-acetyltransferase [Bacillus pseudomycoides]EEM09200.1 Homoserine O-acetyltransferase [Bacillus pseudomycoides]KFN14558.1 alpha/beta hydrolase fold family protein [Bacillus pseudomycoides]MBD5795148.1 homoserine acetyltransferase [Bacillus pseudomycoides]MDR4186402.1 homoserine O-acetyltransferase [Bacillus pseudomycoides]MED0853854.1 homoserine O-acetyltransferase [Bacillus pseudomycoides]